MSDEIKLSTIDVKAVRETLAGYAIAAEYIERERIERLRHMEAEESRAIYADLVALHQKWSAGLKEGDKKGLQRLDDWRLQTKIAVRQAFEKVAKSRGLL